MNNNDKNLNLLLEQIENRERLLRKRSFYLTIIPIIIAGILIWCTSYKIIKAKKELELSRTQVSELNQKLKILKHQLGEATNFVKNIYEIDWTNAKYLASLYPRQARVLFYVREMQNKNVKWKLKGKTPEEGFDSPSFCAYILDKLRITENLMKKRYDLLNFLAPIESPRVGDLIIYENGYTMFYFEDRLGQPFCIGMTPVGIVSLKINFGPKLLGYRKINY